MTEVGHPLRSIYSVPTGDRLCFPYRLAQPEASAAAATGYRRLLCNTRLAPLLGASCRNRPCRSDRLPPLSCRHETETCARLALPVSSLPGRAPFPSAGWGHLQRVGD